MYACECVRGEEGVEREGDRRVVGLGGGGVQEGGGPLTWKLQEAISKMLHKL